MRTILLVAIILLINYSSCVQHHKRIRKLSGMVYKRKEVRTDQAPQPIGAYSQAIAVPREHSTVYLSGTIPLDKSGNLINGTIEEQARQVFTNMKNVAEATGPSLSLDQVVKVNIYLTDLEDFPTVNKVMEEFFKKPYPARSTVGVSSLLKGVKIEIDGEMRI